MVIRVLDHVTSASTYTEGDVIYRLIAEELNSKRAVTISFSGINSLPSAFINGAFVRLLESFDYDYIKANVKFVDSTRQINRLIKDRFNFAAGDKGVELVLSTYQRDKLYGYTKGRGGYQALCERVHRSIKISDGKIIAHVYKDDMARILEAASHGDDGGWQALFRDILNGNNTKI